MDSMSKFVNVIILIFGIFFVTSFIAANLDDRVTQENVTVVTTKFCDNVRKQGMLTQTMYINFTNELDANGILFDIEMVYTKDVVTPELDASGSPTGNSKTTQESYYQNDIMASVFNDEANNGAIIDGDADYELRMNQGDSFHVSVTNRGKTLSGRYREFFPWMGSTNDTISVAVGGLVRDEDWSD